jgi:hypothetical protein
MRGFSLKKEQESSFSEEKEAKRLLCLRGLTGWVFPGAWG